MSSIRFPSFRQSSNLKFVSPGEGYCGSYVPVGQHNATFEILTNDSLTFRVVNTQGADMGRQFGNTASLHPTHCQDGPNNGILIALGYVGARDRDARKYIIRIWVESSNWCLFILDERLRDPGRYDRRNHIKSRVGVLGEITRC